ncbi:alanine--tRNA ligase [Patescibacteria group bacterium]|nr:alanine--tRNA ligase [Patescibacteria group bacterium]
MTAKELKKKFVDFFLDHGHLEIPSASIIPENDPTTLFISAGMHPLVPYLSGQTHPLGKRLVNVQKCIRTGDIDEVGDCHHHTFFEMLGNWSLGDYFKKESISWSLEFLTKHLKINPSEISVTCFEGDKNAPKDNESAQIWQDLGIAKIKFLPAVDNWWGPAGQTGPCGPDTEIFFNGLEIWNNVFMQYLKTANGKFQKLPKPNVDTGMGVERTVAILNGFNDDYLTSIWTPIIKKIEDISGKKYQDSPRPFRIIADHIRSAVFVIADGIEPSNKEAGYVLRRLIRRAIVQAQDLGIKNNFVTTLAETIINNKKNYAGDYDFDTKKIKIILAQEEQKFRSTLDRGLKEIEKLITNDNLSGLNAFNLYQSFGFPLELIKEEVEKRHYKLASDFTDQFNQAKLSHIKLSQTLSAGKFKSGLADHSDITTKYHTATHLLQSALKKTLGEQVHQAGSNLTASRLRFDFNYPDKLTEKQITKIENLVNLAIKSALPVVSKNMPLSTAIASGALHLASAQYPDTVSVYTIPGFSQEICIGPHVSNTSELGFFKITKQESAGSGKRRLYAVLDKI